MPDHDAPLTDLELEILAFEHTTWKYPAVKVAAIRERFDLSEVRYYQVLGALIDRPEAMAAEPTLVRRLQRLRDERRGARSRRVQAG